MRNEIITQAKEYLITSMLSKLQPVVIDKVDRCSIWDVDGKEYLDCFSGISVVNAGHNHPVINKAAMDQMQKLIHACTYVYYVPSVIALAKKLAEITPNSLTKSFFGNSGAEAIECAIKLVRKFSSKHEIIALMGSFHGRTLGTLSLTGQAKRKRYDMGPYLSGIAFAAQPYCYRCPFEQEYPQCNLLCARSLQDTIDYGTCNNVAAFLAEPVMGEGGIIVPPKGYFAMINKILKTNDILFIADEVQSGFGRTGTMFAIEQYDIQPDLITMAKGIANGYPISAVIARSDIGDAFEPGDHLSTFGGNPVSAAASLANIQVIKNEGLCEQSKKNGEYLLTRLAELSERHPLIGDVRGKGLMVGVELVKNRETKIPAVKETLALRDQLLAKHILVGAGGSKGNILRIQPPLIISQEQLGHVVDELDTLLKKI